MDLISFFLELNDPSKSGEVAVGAHVGGTVAGFVAMLLLRGSLNKADEEPVRLAPAPVKAEGLTCLDLLGVQPVYLSVGGQQAGPYPPEAIQGMIDCQSLPEGAYFWQEGMAEWRPVTELLGSPA